MSNYFLNVNSDASARTVAPRVSSDELIVDSNTIGADLHFTLRSKNLSKSGLLLSWEGNVKVPFVENTLLEMRVDVEGAYLNAPLECLGKVVRRVDEPGSPAASFGVKIVQIDGEDLGRWEGAIKELEEKANKFINTSLFDEVEKKEKPVKIYRQPKAS